MPKASPSLASTLPKGYESSALRSPRDSDSPFRYWKRTNDYRRQERANEEALEYLSRAVEKMRRRMLGNVNTDTIPIMPFQIYNIGAWNQFQIRDGILAARSKFWKGGTNNAGGSPTVNAIDFSFSNGSLLYGYVNNYENLLQIFIDREGVLSVGENNPPALPSILPCTTLALTTDTQISGYDDSGNEILFSGAKLADKGAIDWTAVDYQASFWIEIVDDSTKGFFYKVWGRMWNNNGSPITQSSPFPQGENIYPIASIRYVNASGDPEYQQFIIGNKTNRYNSGNLIYRGKWSADSLSGQVFYPDDFVYDDSSPAYLTKTLDTGTGTIKYRGQYKYKGATPNFATTAPHSDATNWQYIGAVI